MKGTISISDKTHLTEAEAVLYSGFSRRVLFEFRTKGSGKAKLPFSVIGGSIRYKKTDIDNFIEKHKV